MLKMLTMGGNSTIFCNLSKKKLNQILTSKKLAYLVHVFSFTKNT